MLQKTLVVLKPDAVNRNVIGEIISRFERVGLHLVAMKMVKPNEEFFHSHYEKIGKLISRRGENTFKAVVDLMTESPVVAMVWEGVEAIDLVRKMIGPTEPKSALPGTIRGDYAHVSYGHSDASGKAIANLVHASADAEEGGQEIKLWFSDAEIFDHEPMHGKFTR